MPDHMARNNAKPRPGAQEPGARNTGHGARVGTGGLGHKMHARARVNMLKRTCTYVERRVLCDRDEARAVFARRATRDLTGADSTCETRAGYDLGVCK